MTSSIENGKGNFLLNLDDDKLEQAINRLSELTDSSNVDEEFNKILKELINNDDDDINYFEVMKKISLSNNSLTDMQKVCLLMMNDKE